MTESVCPFEEGDRVDHKLFGLGTVVGTPMALSGADHTTSSGVCDGGWRIPVHWDNSQVTATEVVHKVLFKVASPDTRPFTYWDRQWQPLLQAWLAARRKVEHLRSSFRPGPQPADLARAQEAEQSAFELMTEFMRQERSGGHS